MNAPRLRRLVVAGAIAVGVVGGLLMGGKATAQPHPKPYKPKFAPVYHPPKTYHPPVVIQPHPLPSWGWGWKPPVYKPVPQYPNYWGGYKYQAGWSSTWYLKWSSGWAGWNK